MSKILVTGAGGFIGSHLVEHLLSQGYEVRAFVRYNSRNFWGWVEEVSKDKRVEIFTGDIRDFDSVYNALKNVEIVFHLAALISVPYSYHSPIAYIKTNVIGTYNLLQASLMHSVKRFVHISTSEVYGTAQYIPIDEKHPVNPQSPYAASKAAADHLVMSFYYSFDLPVTIVRPFNTYGPRQSARAVIPTVIIQALTSKTIKLGNVETIRDFTFVSDTVKGIYLIGTHTATIGKIINIGSGKGVSIKDIIQIIEKFLKSKLEVNYETIRMRPNKSEVVQLVCNFSKAREICGWNPIVSFEEGVAKTINWFQSNLSYYKPEIYNI